MGYWNRATKKRIDGERRRNERSRPMPPRNN
jgi:hypothetical protein